MNPVAHALATVERRARESFAENKPTTRVPAVKIEADEASLRPGLNRNLEERIAELEANQSLNIFTLGGIFISRFDTIDTTAEKNMQYLRLLFSLNLDAQVSNNIRFYSRYTTSKFMTRWRDEGTPAAGSADLNSADNYSSANVVLEKAYVDLLFNRLPLVLSIGRLPTVDGSPSNYWDGRARMGTYPLLTYNAILDGIAATYLLDPHLPKNERLALRALYTPFSQYNSGLPGKPGFVTPPRDANGSRLQTLVNLYSLQVDYRLNDLGYADSANFIVQYYQSGEFNLAGNLNLNVGGTTLMAEFNGIGGTPVDLSLSHLLNHIRSQGFAAGPGTGYGTTAEDEDMHGHVTLASIRYHMEQWFVGFEFLHGSKTSSYYSGASENLTNFYSTRGNAYHIYVTKKIEDNLSVRVGCAEQYVDFAPVAIGIGTQNKTDKIETTYLQLRLDF